MPKKSRKIKTLDLHGYKSDEVFDAVDKFLIKASNSSNNAVHIMTGKGQGIVQKKVIEYLNHAGYHWSYLRHDNGNTNQGVMVIHLD